MRIWDINPGYLNRQSLLGEHRELHGIVSIIMNKKKGYSSHPETLRWRGFGWALKQRHDLLAAEMRLRGYTDRTPVELGENHGIWPDALIDSPFDQYRILKEKYRDRSPGRIPLPVNGQALWSHHKYSVLARDPVLYKQFGKEVSGNNTEKHFESLALVLVETLRSPPGQGGILNSLQHMWGHVSQFSPVSGQEVERWSLSRLLEEVQLLAIKKGESYLLKSTSLSELGVWI